MAVVSLRTRPIVAPTFGARLFALRGSSSRGAICDRLVAFGLSLDRSTLLQYERGTVGSPDPVILWGLGQIYAVALTDLVGALVYDQTGRSIASAPALPAVIAPVVVERPGLLRDYGGALLLADVARVLRTSPSTIRRRVQAGTFPIPPLPGIDNRLRWSGPVIKRWLEKNGPRVN